MSAWDAISLIVIATKTALTVRIAISAGIGSRRFLRAIERGLSLTRGIENTAARIMRNPCGRVSAAGLSYAVASAGALASGAGLAAGAAEPFAWAWS